MSVSSARRSPSITHIRVDGEILPSVDAVRDLGAWFDNHMTMSVHVKKVVSAIP
jgi:hypothetical protein